VSGEATVDPEVHRALGLTDDEYDTIAGILGRQPNHLELAMYSVMWSEHCSYKSSRVHLRRLPSEAPHVLVGPGEGAGVVDVGDGIGAALRIESHNHPSAIEPYQGAATGVGGILRDIFSMGARPIATMDPLRFGPLDDARSRWIAEGVVSGISGYGNSVGVPTVGGEVVFDETYAENPLVNVLCLGVLPVERLVLARASGVGNLAVLLGSSTGRDGIGGASVLASAGFGEGEDEQAKRPSVQVGDPFEEKRLIEACLELLDRRLAVGVQDLGAAGITGATSETASKGGSGLDVLLSEIPQREPGMAPYEVMISESQERMLAIVEPVHVDEVLAIAAKWEIRASVIGVVNSSGRLRVLDRQDGEVLADVPASSLDSDAPLYHRPLAEPADLTARRARDVTAELLQSAAVVDLAAALAPMLVDTSWVYTQYDHQLFLNTVEAPGGDAAVLRLKHPTSGADTGRGLALTTDGNHRWCAVDPRQGTASVVAEAVLNLAVVGARPLALVNNLNFGNPEHPEVMWELSESIDGMADACRVLGIPVIGGNVSLYNESRGRDIDPTPVVGVLGIVDRLHRRPPGVRVVEGHRLLLTGSPTEANLAGSRFAADAGLPRVGTLPSLDLAAVADTAELVRALVADGLVGGAHDVAEGGLAAALAELAIGGGVGISAARIHGAAELFSESPGRVVLSIAPEHLVEVEERHTAAGVGCVRLGLATGDRLTVKGLLDIALAELTTSWRDALPDALGHGTTQG
jgi:phosphoribosylformylglycinamidine synthase subunit PurL